MNRFKTLILFGLFLIAVPSFGVRLVGPEVSELQDLIRIRDKGERDRSVIAYAEKYFSKNKSIEERVKSIRELGVIMGRPEQGWREGQNFSHLLFRLFNELSEVTPPNEVRQSLAESFVGSLEGKEELEVFFLGVRFPPLTGIGYSSPKAALEDFQEGLSKSVFQKGMVTLKQLSSNEDSRAIASQLMEIAVDDYPKTSAEDLKILWSKGAGFNEQTLRVMSKKIGLEANNLFVSWLESQRNLDSLNLREISDIQERLSDWKSTLSDELQKKLQGVLSDKNVTPEARAAAFRVLQIKNPKSVEDSPEKLLNSKEALDHLVASQVLGDKPEYKDKLTQLLQKDLLSTEDPRVLKVLSGSPLVKEAHWSSGAFTASEIEGVKRLISSRQSFEVRKILDMHPELTGLLTQGLKKKPEKLSDSEFNQEFAERLSKAIKDDPGLLTPQLRQEIAEILLSKDPNLAKTQNTLRRGLPENLTRQLDQEVTQKRLDPSNSDPCQVTCRIAAELEKKLNRSQVTPTIKPYDNGWPFEREQGPMNLALRSLTIEFLLKAKQTGCSVGNVEKQFSDLLVQARSIVKAIESEAERSRSQDSVSEISASLRSAAVETEAAKRALAFLDRSAPKDTQGTSLPLSGTELYFHLQTLRAMNTFQKEGAVVDQKVFDDLKSKLEQSLSEMVEHRAKLELGTRGNSMLNTYAFSAMGASALEGSAVSAPVSQILSDWRKELEEKKNPGFPYAFSYPSDTERGSAARSAVAQLAIYKGGSTAEKLANADKLLLSLQTYDKHLLDVFARVGVGDTHDESNDGLAPYYGPSTLPYVFEAISLLRKEPGMTSEHKKRLGEVSESILKKTLGMIQPNGLFQPQDEKLYRAAEFYDNALVGLGLAQACTDSKLRPDTSSAKTETRERKKTTPTH